MSDVPPGRHMSEIPGSYAYLRSWGIDSFGVCGYSALAANWTMSQNIMSDIRRMLDGAELHSAVRTVAVAGSLGRMEASYLSDADLIVVLHDWVDPDSREALEAFQSVWSALAPLNLAEPKETGVFSTPCTEEQLCGRYMGSAEEELRVYGKRQLLLLESQPVYRNGEYASFMDSIVRRFAPGYTDTDPRKGWAFMLNDLLRYFRVLCVSYQWDFENETLKWPLRNIKLRHSRLIMFSGLLFLLGEASKERGDRVQWLKVRLRLTPLERMALVYRCNEDWSFPRVAGLYDVFLSKMNDREVRKFLQSHHAHGEDDRCEDCCDDDYDESHLRSHYSQLKANSDRLVVELLRFILARRGVWSERFFEYLLF